MDLAEPFSIGNVFNTSQSDFVGHKCFLLFLLAAESRIICIVPRSNAAGGGFFFQKWQQNEKIKVLPDAEIVSTN